MIENNTIFAFNLTDSSCVFFYLGNWYSYYSRSVGVIDLVFITTKLIVFEICLKS